MLPEVLRVPVTGLLSLCVAVAALEHLSADSRAARPFYALCALGVAVCAVRAALGLFQ